jgi:ribonuclease HI
MPWVRATLHGQNIYARARADGSLVENGGRVDVCYKTNAARVYRARASNIVVTDRTVLPDDACMTGASQSARPASGEWTSAEPGDPPPKRARKARSTSGTRPVSSPGAAAAPPSAVVEKDVVIAYADGACSGNPGPSGLGVVLIDGSERVELSESLGVGTNNIAELTAIERVLDLVPQADRAIEIYTDSGYAIGVLSKGWKAKANVVLVERIRSRLVGRRAVRFVHVRGHAGIPLNERADELARDAVRTGKTQTARRREHAPPHRIES